MYCTVHVCISVTYRSNPSSDHFLILDTTPSGTLCASLILDGVMGKNSRSSGLNGATKLIVNGVLVHASLTATTVNNLPSNPSYHPSPNGKTGGPFTVPPNPNPSPGDDHATGNHDDTIPTIKPALSPPPKKADETHVADPRNSASSMFPLSCAGCFF